MRSAARDEGDAERAAEVALRLPFVQQFGEHPGQIPAFIHEAYAAAVDPSMQARLAAALARAWVYGGDPARGVPFADKAVALADRLGDPVIIADGLDAALVSRWGPDNFHDRLGSMRLADAAAHLTESCGPANPIVRWPCRVRSRAPDWVLSRATFISC